MLRPTSAPTAERFWGRESREARWDQDSPNPSRPHGPFPDVTPPLSPDRRPSRSSASARFPAAESRPGSPPDNGSATRGQPNSSSDRPAKTRLPQPGHPEGHPARRRPHKCLLIGRGLTWDPLLPSPPTPSAPGFRRATKANADRVGQSLPSTYSGGLERGVSPSPPTSHFPTPGRPPHSPRTHDRARRSFCQQHLLRTEADGGTELDKLVAPFSRKKTFTRLSCKYSPHIRFTGDAVFGAAEPMF